MNVGKKNRKKSGRVPKKRIERSRNCSGKFSKNEKKNEGDITVRTLDEDHNLEVDVPIHTEEETNFVCTGTGDDETTKFVRTNDEKKGKVHVPTPSPPSTHQAKEGGKKILLTLNLEKMYQGIKMKHHTTIYFLSFLMKIMTVVRAMIVTLLMKMNTNVISLVEIEYFNLNLLPQKYGKIYVAGFVMRKM